MKCQFRSQMYHHQLNTGMIILCIATVLCLFLSQALAIETEYSETEEATVSLANNSTNSSLITDGMDSNNNDDGKDGGNAGLIAGVLVPIFLVVIIAVVVFIIHKRRSRMMDNEKKMKIQMTSARNAGVYQDLTVTVPADAEKPPASPEHERLQSAEEI